MADLIGVMRLGDTQITVSKTVKSLEVTLKETLSFCSHVDNVCEAAHSTAEPHRRMYIRVYTCVDEATARMVSSSMVDFRIDYCNSVFHRTSAGNLGKLQRVISAFARMVSGVRKRDHITPVLCKVKWLPVTFRITFMIARLTFKAISTNKPGYKKVKKVQVFDTPQVVNCFKVESDSALLPSWFNW